MEYGQTAYNRSVYASGAVAPSGSEKPQSGLRPLCIWSGGLCSASPYVPAQTSVTARTINPCNGKE
jgi:hypothetical protein